jgi:hypothetical protein
MLVLDSVQEPVSAERAECHHCGGKEGEEWEHPIRNMKGASVVPQKRTLRLSPDMADNKSALFIRTCNECDWLDDLEQLEEALRESESPAKEEPSGGWTIAEIKARFNDHQRGCYEAFKGKHPAKVYGAMTRACGSWTREQLWAIDWLTSPEKKYTATGRTTVLSVLYAEGAIGIRSFPMGRDGVAVMTDDHIDCVSNNRRLAKRVSSLIRHEGYSVKEVWGGEAVKVLFEDCDASIS